MTGGDTTWMGMAGVIGVGLGEIHASIQMRWTDKHTLKLVIRTLFVALTVKKRHETKPRISGRLVVDSKLPLW